ncbi:MAG TPA: choice-of-anchor tandem repeat GloVer-containing protein [Candidatus Sulfotelmatobacter sp.]|jgi:hypothetical protein
MTTNSGVRGRFLTFLVLIFSLAAFAAGPQEKVLYNFQGAPDGTNPSSSLIADREGHLYGTTASGGTGMNCEIAYQEVVACGTVFELIPPTTRGGRWTEKILYNFQGGKDGSVPLGSLILDEKGNLYGTTAFGGLSTNCTTGISGYYPGCGTVFRLSPPSNSGGAWSEALLHVFQGGLDGGEPQSGVIFDAKGNLYGTTEVGGDGYCHGDSPGCGLVFKLSPPRAQSDSWTENILWAFKGLGGGYEDGAAPRGSLLLSNDGKLYGTTSSGGSSACYSGSCGGTVFQLSPDSIKGQPWIEAVLFNFYDVAGGATFPGPNLIFDKNGILYGTTDLGGPGSCDNQEEYAFPSCGTIFSLAPPSGGSWTFTTLYNFVGGSDGAYPEWSGLVIDGKGNLYGTSAYAGGQGSCTQIKDISGMGCGTVFKLSPPTASVGTWTETTLHAFGGDGDGGTPYGGLLLKDGTLFGTTTGYSNSSGSNGTVFAIRP